MAKFESNSTSLSTHLLWDVDLQTFDYKDYPEFLAERIAEKGKVSDIRWYFKHFGEAKFYQCVAASRGCSPSVKNFWIRYEDNASNEDEHK